MKKLLSIFILILFIPIQTNAFEDFFIFGLRLQDNEYELVPKIEDKFWVKVPLVSVIYDDFWQWEAVKLAKTFAELWNERVYHISINPFGYNLKTLIEDKYHGWWERKYKALFKLIKKYDVKVIFRSLHEMNGWWYSRSSDPYRFKIFWKMMYWWSRDMWLDRSNILFDMSINSQDLPAVEWFEPSQTTPVITCNQEIKKKIWCPTFEDYYPWDEYVDMLWVTIYNWWKWARKEEWAKWRNPLEVINEPWYRTFDRMKKIWKPIFIDESGTTSINIDEPYNELKLIDIYKQYHTPIDWITATWTRIKNSWIAKLTQLYTDPQVIWWAYFNADVTYWLNDRRQIGELDWTAIDPVNNFAYSSIINILNDYRNLDFPTFYFDLSDKIYNSRKWITDRDIYELHDLVSKFMVYKKWNIIMSEKFSTRYPYAKYQFYLEKELSKNPELCEHISSKFNQIQCGDTKLDKDYLIKKKVFGILKSRIEKSPIRLSNWWIWEQIEQIKLVLLNKWKNSFKTQIMIDYLQEYEDRLLDLR